MLFFGVFFEVGKKQVTQLLRWRDLVPLPGSIKLRIAITPAVVFFLRDLARFQLGGNCTPCGKHPVKLFVREHPDTKLIIIDTMQKIREVGGEAYSCASDYEIIGKLKQFADRHRICVLTVHHTRKQPAGDSFEMISGTTGLLGCADGSLLNANGKTVLRKSYSVLQDDFFAAMRKAGYDDVERGERGSSEEHLTVTQFKVQQEQARLAEFTEQNRQQEKQAATLGSKIEKIQNQRVDVRSIEKIVATSIPFSSKVAVEREDFDRLSTLAKKYVTAEKKESKLQKALDAANKLIAKLKTEIAGLKQELSAYKSVRSKLRTADLERENAELRGRVQCYEDVIQRNHLWHFFHLHREKAVTRDKAR